MEVAVKNSDVAVPKQQLLRYHQREELKGEIEAIEGMLDSRNPHRLKTSTDTVEAQRRVQRLKKSLETQSPMELPGFVKDKLYKEAKAIEERVTHDMPTQEEMRKNPAGMVGKHMKWEKVHKRDILRWKNIQQMLEPNSDDPDLSNFERLRPAGIANRLRTDAQIQGQMTYQNIPQEKWDAAFEGKGPENTALKQVQRRQMTEEQKEAARQRLAAARAKKHAMKQNPPSEVDQSAPVREGEPVLHEGA